MARGQNENTRSSDGRDSFLVLTGLKNVSWLVMLSIAAATAFYSSKSNHESGIQENRSTIVAMEKEIARVERLLATHSALGHNGTAHPQGTINTVNDLRREIDSRTADRFTFKDHTNWLIETYLPKVQEIESKLDRLEKQMR